MGNSDKFKQPTRLMRSTNMKYKSESTGDNFYLKPSWMRMRILPAILISNIASPGCTKL
jgi:hypothetical protein